MRKINTFYYWLNSSGFYLSLLFLVSSCNGIPASNEETQQLSNPTTIKGMKLGLEYNNQIEIGEQNGLCKSEFKNSKCHYNLTETIMAQPKLSYSLYNDERVLDKVELTLYSPYNFPLVSDENGNTIAEYPSLTNAEIQEVITMFKTKYGNPEEETWEYGGYAEWIVNDEMQITLTYTTTEYTYGFQIHPQVKDAFTEDAFSTKVVYEFTEKNKELLKEDPNIDGKPIGDNI